MIKNPQEYREESERERREYLRRLTIKESAEIIESLVDEELIRELKFSDHFPVSLKIGLKNAKNQISHRL